MEWHKRARMEKKALVAAALLLEDCYDDPAVALEIARSAYGLAPDDVKRDEPTLSKAQRRVRLLELAVSHPGGERDKGLAQERKQYRKQAKQREEKSWSGGETKR